MLTEKERERAIVTLADLRRQDETVKMMVNIVLSAEGQPSIGHLARYCPEQFDILFEEASAIAENPE